MEVKTIDEGQGPAILVLPPGMDDGTGWGRVAALLAARFRVVRLCRRPYRRDLTDESAPFATAGLASSLLALTYGRPFTMAQEVSDVAEVAARIGEPLVVVGHSSGGVLALESLVAWPDAFAGAVIYEAPTLLTATEWDGAVAQAQALVAAGHPGRAMTVFMRDIVRIPPAAARLSGLAIGLTPRWRALARGQIEDAAAIAELGVRLDAYARIEVPTVLLGGERSPAHLDQRAEALRRVLPDAEKVVLPRQGHGANRTAPAEVAGVIAALADRVRHS